MISKINHLTNFGNYHQFQWGGTTPLAKRNLIYGWNYSGKTTLSRLFQILAEPNQLAQWQGSQFEVELQGGATMTHANLANPPRVKVFNRDFIQRNFQQEHQAPAVFIVGGNTIHLRNRITRLNEHEIRIQAIKARLGQSHQQLQNELDLLGTNHARSVATVTGDRTYNRTKLIAEVDRVKATPNAFILSEDVLQAKVSLLRSTEQWRDINPVNNTADNPDALRQSLLAVIQKSASNEAIAKLKENRDLQSAGDGFRKDAGVGDISRGVEGLDVLLDQAVIEGGSRLGCQVVENALLAKGGRPHELDVDLLDDRRLRGVLRPETDS